jgi:ubiquinone/menaquinone biosynthesis C-methylase UbiE
MKRTSEKKHWDDFWAASSELDDVYGTDDRIVQHLAQNIDLPGRVVLEVGAGTGRDADKLAARGAMVFALDYSEESLDLMGRSIRRAVYIVCGDGFRLPFRDETFDVVFHQGLLEHFKNPGDMLDEHRRVLKPGGLLLVDVPQRYHYYTVLKHILIVMGKWFAGWETEFSLGELRGLLERRGMQVIAVYGHNPSPPIWYRGVRKVLLKMRLRLPMYPKPPRSMASIGDFFRKVIPAGLRVNTSMVIGCIARRT